LRIELGISLTFVIDLGHFAIDFSENALVCLICLIHTQTEVHQLKCSTNHTDTIRSAKMAATAVSRVGLGQITANFETLNSRKPQSSFLGKPLFLKPHLNASTQFKSRRKCMIFASGFELFDPIKDLFLGVGVGLPCTVMECGDIIYRSTLPKSSGLTLTVPGAMLALGAVSYLWATPGVAPGSLTCLCLLLLRESSDPLSRRCLIFVGLL